jgi:anti-sigma B factor antagonist
MEINIRAVADVTVFEIAGSVDSLTAERLTAAFASRLDSDPVHLVADLGGVDYTSSAGLRALLATLKDARRRGGDFRLANVQPPVMRVLELSGFTSILNLFPDVDAAVASFPAGATATGTIGPAAAAGAVGPTAGIDGQPGVGGAPA